jgi:hypothetical protein
MLARARLVEPVLEAAAVCKQKTGLAAMFSRGGLFWRPYCCRTGSSGGHVSKLQETRRTGTLQTV